MLPLGDTNDEKNRSAALLERLSFDQTIHRVFSIYCQGFTEFTTLASMLFVLPTLVISFVVQPALIEWKGLDPEEAANDPTYALNHMGDIMILAFLKSACVFVFAWLFAAMVTHGVGTIYLGRQIQTTQCLQGGFRRAWPFIVAALLAQVITWAGFVLLIVPGFYISVRFFVLAPAIIIENAGVMNGMRRSCELTKHSWCYVFCISFVVILIMVPGHMIWNIFAHLAFGDINFSSWGFLVSSLYFVFVFPVSAIAQSVMYFNLRVEKEGLNADALWDEFRQEQGRVPDDAVVGQGRYEQLVDNEDEEEAAVAPGNQGRKPKLTQLGLQLNITNEAIDSMHQTRTSSNRLQR